MEQEQRQTADTRDSHWKQLEWRPQLNGNTRHWNIMDKCTIAKTRNTANDKQQLSLWRTRDSERPTGCAKAKKQAGAQARHSWDTQRTSETLKSYDEIPLEWRYTREMPGNGDTQEIPGAGNQAKAAHKTAFTQRYCTTLKMDKCDKQRAPRSECQDALLQLNKKHSGSLTATDSSLAIATKTTDYRNKIIHMQTHVESQTLSLTFHLFTLKFIPFHSC